MARKRTGTIAESLERLEELERRYLGEPQEARIKALRLLKEDPSRTTTEVGAIMSCSERTVRRWWSTYQNDGLNALLEVNAGEEQTPTNLDVKALELLGRMVERGELTEIEEIRTWLLKEYGMRFSRSEMRYITKMRLGLELRTDGLFDAERGTGSQGPSAQMPQGIGMLEMVQFLNMLPLTEDTNEWSACFRSALLVLFKDVSHIAVNINQTCNLTNPQSYQPTMVLRQHNSALSRMARGVVLTTQEDEGRPSERVLEEFRLQGRPLDRYHPPITFDYYYEGFAYLGSIFLFQERSKGPISDRTIATIDALEPFLVHSMANHVMWYLRNKPSEQIFQEGLQRMIHEAELSAQEQRIVIYHLLGYSYDEMADLLTISTKTVKKHISTIHHKTGTHRQRELFARYFSPRIAFHPTVAGD